MFGYQCITTLGGYYKLNFPEGLGRSNNGDMHARVLAIKHIDVIQHPPEVMELRGFISTEVTRVLPVKGNHLGFP